VRDAVCSSAVDLVFVLDASGSIEDIGTDTWRLMLDFTASVVRQFNVGRNTAHFGLIRYSNNADVAFRLQFDRFCCVLGLFVASNDKQYKKLSCRRSRMMLRVIEYIAQSLNRHSNDTLE